MKKNYYMIASNYHFANEYPKTVVFHYFSNSFRNINFVFNKN